MTPSPDRNFAWGKCLSYAPPKERTCDEFWDAASEKQRRAILWDEAMAGRGESLKKQVACAGYALAAWLGNRPFALAWATPLVENSLTAHIHFFFCGDSGEKKKLLRIAEIFTLRCILLKYHTLLALLPRHYHGTRRLLRQLEFARVCSLKKAGRVNGALSDLALYVLNRDGSL